MKEFKSIGVIGATGMVGGATARWFDKKGYGVIGHSRSAEDFGVFQCDLIFVCVPTPYSWEYKKFNRAILDEVFGMIDAEKDDNDVPPVVVIKSTVPIGTTEYFQEKYPEIPILFNPEFLSEATCNEDFANPDRQFVGYTDISKPFATKVLNTLPESPYDVIMPVKEAELLKYINNVHGMIEIMEANHFYDVCEKEGLDYERVTKATMASKWVGCPMGRHYRKVMHKGFRGFGGKCFPKDINAFIEYCDEKGIRADLFKATRDFNRHLLKEQGYTEEQAENL